MPADKARKIGVKLGMVWVARIPIMAPAGSAKPETKAILNRDFLPCLAKRMGMAMANSSGILCKAMDKEIKMPRLGECR